uniref:Fatty acid desaturase 6 n=1 Tax=Lygus hesperus TaxID=30085 RepID=A0A0A9WRX3_LYGHE
MHTDPSRRLAEQPGKGHVSPPHGLTHVLVFILIVHGRLCCAEQYTFVFAAPKLTPLSTPHVWLPHPAPLDVPNNLAQYVVAFLNGSPQGVHVSPVTPLHIADTLHVSPIAAVSRPLDTVFTTLQYVSDVP